MIVRNLIFFFLLVVCANCFSQQNKSAQTTDITKVSVIGPAVSYEKSAGHKGTVHAQAFLNLSFAFSYSSSFGANYFLYANPAAGIQYRYYYNGARRETMGKRTAMNSMNYIAPLYTIAFSNWSVSKDYYGEEKRRLFHNLALVWGFQRNYEKRFSIDVNVGPGFAFVNTTLYDQNYQPTGTELVTSFELAAQVRIGFWLNRK